MKHIQTFESFLNEGGLNESTLTNENFINKVNEMNLNDPILVAIRASKDDRKKSVAAQAERKKKRVYGKARKSLEDKLWDISQDLKDAYIERSDIYNDMDSEAGQKGDEWTDDDGNLYGQKLNQIDAQIENLLAQRQQIELTLLY